MPNKQGPPQNEHGKLDLPATYVGAQPKPGKDPLGGGFRVPPTRPGGMGSGITYNEGLRRETRDNIKATEALVKKEYSAKSQDLPRSTEVELANVRAQYTSPTTTLTQTYQHEINVRNVLIQQKTTELHTQTVLANTFYGHSPLNSTIGDFLSRAQVLDRIVTPWGPAYSTWVASYKAAYSAKLLTEQIHLLNNQQLHVQNVLAAAHAQEQKQREAEQEAQRVAAEQTRLAAEQEAQRVAAEEARKAQEARARAEAAAKELAERDAQIKELLEAMEILNAARANKPFPLLGTAAAGPVFTASARSIATSTTTTQAIQTSLRAAVLAVLEAAAAPASAVVGGFAALLWPSPLGNSDLYALSVPLTDLTSLATHDLHAIGEANGEIALPVAIGSRTVGNTTEFFVAATNGTTVPAKVPVRLAVFDSGLNAYQTYNPDLPSIGMTWTPIVKPNDASTTLPAGEQKIAVYDGASAIALEGRVDAFPALDLYNFGGFIYVFPADSGIPPLYIVFNSPYEGATVKAKHSDRYYNPEQAGGPILYLDFRPVVIAQDGIISVELHTSRLDQCDGNDIMIARLKKILSGHLDATDTDLRFYTHELRELERYRALGYNDDVRPPDSSPVWNNAHTATLEDYQLGESLTLLYTEEAVNAMNAQDEREYQKNLKERAQ
jgi:hypothetical protein